MNSPGMKRTLTLLLALPFGMAGAVSAQIDVATNAITEARVREVLGYLASDALAGRDTPSPGLAQAGLFLAWSFAKAGLSPAGTDPSGDAVSFFHAYTLPGIAFRSDAARLVLHHGDAERRLVPGVDFRLWEAGRGFSGEGVDVAFPVASDDPREARRRMAGRSVGFYEAATGSPLWSAAGDGRSVISRRAPGGAPSILLRAGLAQAEGDTMDIEVDAPRQIEIALRNVAALWRGTDLADEYVLVSAHYDHIGIRPGPVDEDTVCNGADDDGTGTTAVLLLAEHFARVPPLRRSLLFVCFSGEEKGLRGSSAFAENPPVPLEKIAAVVNLEMLGRPEREAPPFVWITGNEYSDFAAIVEPALAAKGVELTAFEMSTRLFGASDNFSFARKGVVAHSISAGTLHKDYHRPSDEVDRIAFPHMTAVIRGIAGAIETLANRDERPAYNAAGRRVLDR